MTQFPNPILGKFMIFYGTVFLVYSISSIIVTILNTQNFNLFWIFYVPLFVPHVFVFETLFSEFGIRDDALRFMWGIVIGIFGTTSLVSAFGMLQNKQWGISFVFWLMVISIVFSIFSIVLMDFEHPGYEIFSIIPLVVSSLVLYYMKKKRCLYMS